MLFPQHNTFVGSDIYTCVPAVEPEVVAIFFFSYQQHDNVFWVFLRRRALIKPETCPAVS